MRSSKFSPNYFKRWRQGLNMKVNALRLFLRSLQSAVSATDGGSSIPAELDRVSTGLEPFAEFDFGQFAAFLEEANQYRTTGVVSVPTPAGIEAEKVQSS